ncbi:unnamed protein product [Prorocentrum cordatum]|uniref:Uncharacterized protein n=1 Tax=Prorocentrum cordatum TaxID=2364126 RepID=A0ABN9Y068_9DINO|nr:unnamed protein product [Polarella glacialis]
MRPAVDAAVSGVPADVYLGQLLGKAPSDPNAKEVHSATCEGLVRSAIFKGSDVRIASGRAHNPTGWPRRGVEAHIWQWKALAATALSEGDTAVAAVILVSFKGFLRPVEAMLQASHLAWDFDSGSAHINLGFAKGGKRAGVAEHVVIDELEELQASGQGFANWWGRSELIPIGIGPAACAREGPVVVPAGKRRDLTTEEMWGTHVEKDLKAAPKTFAPRDPGVTAKQRFLKSLVTGVLPGFPGAEPEAHLYVGRARPPQRRRHQAEAPPPGRGVPAEQPAPDEESAAAADGSPERGGEADGGQLPGARLEPGSQGGRSPPPPWDDMTNAERSYMQKCSEGRGQICTQRSCLRAIP